jgi:hypothetical protein
MSDDIELSDMQCPNCGHEAYRRDCFCEDGLSYHDCGEDVCCCVAPEPNVRCADCYGHGQHIWCRRCGWDLLLKRFLNGRDERTAAELQEDHERER